MGKIKVGEGIYKSEISSRPHITVAGSSRADASGNERVYGVRVTTSFPNGRDWNRPMSDNGVRTALRAMGFSKEVMTPHGFRAMARTILEEELDTQTSLLNCKFHTRFIPRWGVLTG